VYSSSMKLVSELGSVICHKTPLQCYLPGERARLNLSQAVRYTRFTYPETKG